MIFPTREELLSGSYEYESYEDARDFALKMSNHYDLHNQIVHALPTRYFIIFLEHEDAE